MDPTNESSVDPSGDVRERSKVEQRLGQLGRTLKNVDLRGRVIDNPFAAISIAAGIGALVGLVRPRPEPSRGISGALVGALGALAFRVLREAALYQLGQVARSYVGQRREGGGTREDMRTPPVEASGVRYTPSL